MLVDRESLLRSDATLILFNGVAIRAVGLGARSVSAGGLDVFACAAVVLVVAESFGAGHGGAGTSLMICCGWFNSLVASCLVTGACSLLAELVTL